MVLVRYYSFSVYFSGLFFQEFLYFFHLLGKKIEFSIDKFERISSANVPSLSPSQSIFRQRGVELTIPKRILSKTKWENKKSRNLPETERRRAIGYSRDRRRGRFS